MGEGSAWVGVESFVGNVEQAPHLMELLERNYFERKVGIEQDIGN